MPQFITEYHAEIAKLRAISGSTNESVLREAFHNCLKKYCERKKLTLIDELPDKPGTRPDGTVKDSMRLRYGFWEAKDEKDDLDKEINKKNDKGYPTSNIIYENTRTAALIQNDHEVMRVDMADADALHRLITAFLNYQPQDIADFHKAIEKFKQDMPEILHALRGVIDDAHQSNSAFTAAADGFLMLCQKSINPHVEFSDVREMLIQHILTKKIFLQVFNDDQFHKENNIASRLDDLEETFFTGNTRRDVDDRMRVYYGAITGAAATMDGHHEKQHFLKVVYENFYQVYNKKAADRLGVVYTPNEIVGFMIRVADKVTHKHFGRHLYDDNVQILDPAAGTGTFIADLIEFIPPAHLSHKYQNEIHANEVGILPYYIANLNIEYTYKQKTNSYQEFTNICFVDTLDNVYFGGKGQSDLIGAMSHENLERVQRQNRKEISVIIGNPPYNANQRNENDNNKNREYPGVDKRIKETYIETSAAQKTKQYDMYKRFIRWASDRLKNDGVLAFITNRAYIDAKQDDGFRATAAQEFSAIYIVDLGGDIRTTAGAGNVFGIMTGVAIGFFVRQKDAKQTDATCDIRYFKLDDHISGDEKLAQLSNLNFAGIEFKHIIPDSKHNWIKQTDNDFDELLCVANKQTKLAKPERKTDENAIFKLYSMGVATNRDDWVYDFDKTNLRKKVKFFAKTYNSFLGDETQETNTIIKWSRDLKNEFRRHKKITVRNEEFTHSLYRPFTKKLYFANFITSDVLTKNHYEIFGEKLNKKNKIICFSGVASSKSFQAMATIKIPGLDFLEKTQCLPLYRYDKNDNRHSNLTEYGLTQFRDHYANPNITAEEIFHYVYAVLHNPAYLKKYQINLTREFPRMPFYDDFAKWEKWGVKLMQLHCDFETHAPHKLARNDKPCQPGDAKLKADKEKGIITLDEQTTLAKIPAQAWRYQLGNRSALEWVLDQYKEKKPRDPTIRKKFNNYTFAQHKENVIELLGKVCAVSVRTMEIVEEMNRSAE